MGRYLTRKLDGRLDDDEEMFHRRYDEFMRLNPDVLDYYRDLGVLVPVCLYSQSFKGDTNRFPDRYERGNAGGLSPTYGSVEVEWEMDVRGGNPTL